MSAKSRGIDRPLDRAICSSATQNSASSATDVRCPDKRSERFTNRMIIERSMIRAKEEAAGACSQRGRRREMRPHNSDGDSA